jgi:hypothetical protein
MDLLAECGDVSEEMCLRNLRGVQTGKARQQETGDGLGRARKQWCEKQPPRVAKNNVHGCDSLGVEWQAYGSSPQTTPSFIYWCEALCREKLWHYSNWYMLWPLVRTSICYWYYRHAMEHDWFITVSYRILWYVWWHFYCLQYIMASHVWESQLTNMMFNTDVDTDKLVFTYNEDTSQLQVISEQSCH